MKITHPLHVLIGNILDETISEIGNSSLELIKDDAAESDNKIPLFSSEEKSSASRYCEPDLLVTKNDKIRVIIEIEETSLDPTHICGKYLTSALSEYYIHEDKDDRRIPMDKKVTFFQILETKNLKMDQSKHKRISRKPDQWRNLEKSIRNKAMIPGSITDYYLFYGTYEQFKDEYYSQLIDFKMAARNSLI